MPKGGALFQKYLVLKKITGRAAHSKNHSKIDFLVVQEYPRLPCCSHGFGKKASEIHRWRMGRNGNSNRPLERKYLAGGAPVALPLLKTTPEFVSWCFRNIQDSMCPHFLSDKGQRDSQVAKGISNSRPTGTGIPTRHLSPT